MELSLFSNDEINLSEADPFVIFDAENISMRLNQIDCVKNFCDKFKINFCDSLHYYECSNTKDSMCSGVYAEMHKDLICNIFSCLYKCKHASYDLRSSSLQNMILGSGDQNKNNCLVQNFVKQVKSSK